MRLIRFSNSELTTLKEGYERFPVWIDADRVAAVMTAFRSETWGGRSYHIPTGAFVQLDCGEHVTVAESAEVVAQLISGQPA